MGTDCHQPAHSLSRPSFALPGVADLLSLSRPSPIDTAYHRPRHSPSSPTTNVISIPDPSTSHFDQSPAQIPPTTQLAPAQALSFNSSVPTEAPRPQEYVLGVGANSITSASDHGSNSTTRQQRFNVRFVANYTSENMPLHKPRNDPASATPASTDTCEPQATSTEPPVAPSVELSISPVIPNPPPTEAHTQGRQRRRDPLVERCPGCNEAWKRPLPNTDLYRHSSPAENTSDYSKITMNMVAHLVDHGKKADAMYDRWKWKHSHCVPLADDDFGLLTPPVTESQDDVYATGSEDSLYDSKRFNIPPNKRKAELLHDDVSEQRNSKVQKVVLDPEPSSAPLASPSDLG